MHLQPGLYFRPRTPVLHVITAASLLWLVVRPPFAEILVHEAAAPPPFRPDYRLLGLAFARARLLFHTDAERRALEHDYRIRTNPTLVPHTDSVIVHATVGRDDARTRLGIAPERPIFVCGSSTRTRVRPDGSGVRLGRLAGASVRGRFGAHGDAGHARVRP